MEFIECKSKEEKKARRLIEKGATRPTSTARPTARSCSRTRTSRSASPTTSCRPSRTATSGRRAGSPTGTADGHRTRPALLMDQMAEGTWHCGDPGVQYDTTINRWHTCPNSGRSTPATRAASTCSSTTRPATWRSINLMKFRQRGRHVRRRAVPGGLPDLLHRPGNPGRPRQLSDRPDRAQQPPVPPAGPGLLEPRQPAHGRRACRTTRDAGRGAAGAITALLHGAGEPDQRRACRGTSARSTASR